MTGDLHGDLDRFKTPAAKKLGPGDTLLVCGDFGFLWDGSKEEQKRLRKLSEKKFDICFVEGSHENFSMLEQYEPREWNGGMVRQIAGNIFHLMRGQIFQIEDLRVFTMGGGESPDLDIRIANNNWYPEESPNEQELIAGADNLAAVDNEVDVIITHEPSAKVKEFLQMKMVDKSRITLLNTYFEELSQAVEYKKWYFGSLHLDKHVSGTQTAVFTQILEATSGKPITAVR